MSDEAEEPVDAGLPASDALPLAEWIVYQANVPREAIFPNLRREAEASELMSDNEEVPVEDKKRKRTVLDTDVPPAANRDAHSPPHRKELEENQVRAASTAVHDEQEGRNLLPATTFKAKAPSEDKKRPALRSPNLNNIDIHRTTLLAQKACAIKTEAMPM
jgi:hypothetical protein